VLGAGKASEALKAVTSPPFTVKYPFVPSPPPISFRGAPEFDEDKCVGCGMCIEHCPSKALEIKNLGEERELIVHYDKCLQCSHCNYQCKPIYGLKPTTRYSLIFTDKEEAKLSITKPTVVVKVNEDACIGCARCEYICKFKAAKVKKKEERAERKWVSTIDPDKCKGCGACAAACPAIIIETPLSSNENILSEIRKTPSSSSGKPNILILHCNWARMTPEELANQVPSANLKFVNITCSGRLSPIFVLEGFNRGYDAVMVLCCPEEECHFERGVKIAKPLVNVIKMILSEIGISPERFELVTASNVDPDKYRKAVLSMVDRLSNLKGGAKGHAA